MTRLREPHPAPLTKPAPAPKPPPIAEPVSLTIRLTHLAMDPVRVAQWISMKLGPEATLAIRDAFDHVLADPTITAEYNPFREE
jgi:hypothetical protein